MNQVRVWLNGDLPGAQLPRRASAEAAGFDLCAALGEAVQLPPLGRTLVPTGVHLQLPRGTEAQVRPRSGLALKFGVTVLNSPGTIDSDYRGEVKVLLVNLSGESFAIEPGMRIAQLVFAAVLPVELEALDSRDALDTTERAAGGFGSTGLHT